MNTSKIYKHLNVLRNCTKNLISEQSCTDFGTKSNFGQRYEILFKVTALIPQLFSDILKNYRFYLCMYLFSRYNLENSCWPLGNALLGSSYRRPVCMSSFQNRFIHISCHEKNQQNDKLKMVSKFQLHGRHPSQLDPLLTQVALAAGQVTFLVKQDYHLHQPWYCFTTSRC